MPRYFYVMISAVILMTLAGRDVSADTAKFGCDIKTGACHFRVLYNGGGSGSTNFTMRAGEEELIPNVTYGKDSYCVCIDTPVPANWCSAGSYFCKGYLPISGGRNN